ncbi:beta-galactosidase [Collinsella sp. AGMB00827]|uniref:Beta-galactosidase n=1 Tax=Collinsella ureilytica TaxID=2869515 RepID=A0ABS7MJ84_9ACTN|nr:beta-galactosidase family protein [Collinsella urealyticum]MBY4797427.1 beta-galactosidase [Collinsella urealyticum]
MTHTFEITDELLLDGKAFKIMAGAIHYFRVHPTDWYHSLYNLKALGFNTVETYVPWNLHEPTPDIFNFEGICDLEAFLDMAAELGLFAIVRPSPYICAEWEFGGMPAWLLADRSMRPRSRDERFLARVASYYDELMARLRPHQLDAGGNIIMMQVENEYGSYCEDKHYLNAIREMMIARGITVPLCTSDGPWRACLRAGSLIDQDVLPCGNFGSRAHENFAELARFHREHQKTWPLMCMEFWDGWFNRWGEEVIRRDPEELDEAVGEVLDEGSICLYMFHGGTNFGFMNGCSARLQLDLPQVTSYDYDAPLDEQGNPTPKYYALASMLKKRFPELEQSEPLIKKSLPARVLTRQVNTDLFENLEAATHTYHDLYTHPMEDLGQNLGYILYRTQIERDSTEPEHLRVIDARDRIHVFVNGELVATQYQTEIGEDIMAELKDGNNQLDILVKNMGRVNYGHKLLADTQRKGIRTRVCADLHFISNFEHYGFDLTVLPRLNFTENKPCKTPSFHRFEVTLSEDEILDTNLDLTGFGKGVAFVNGQNVGRFWECGPIRSLYVPHGMLHAGTNEIVIFETEGVYRDQLALSPAVVYEPVAE